MATLVLTTIGGAIGGPIGAALGGLLGQSVDRELLKPKGREGPRLTELKLQTSSYGTAIPQLFGKLRVAGSVIWATDLVEHRHRDGGKGRPTMTSYSYTASFAVALSARRVQGIGRIWADGKLLRGAAGDWKTPTGFRFHPGSEDQAPDPLIASAEGVALAPAHRGVAYAVFEDLELADFGNRIPSLTFEVVADPADIAAGAIVEAVSDALIEAGEAGAPIGGFSAYGGSRRAVIEPLVHATGAWPALIGGRMRLNAGSGSGAVVEDRGGPVGEGVARRAIAAIDQAPCRVTLAHYDPARDYQAGLQQAMRPGAGHRVEAIELPAVLAADEAKRLAQAALTRADVERERRTLATGWPALSVVPGARVRIGNEPGVWRVVQWRMEGMAISLDLVRIVPAALPASASSGRVLASPDAIAGTTIVHAFELPHLGEGALSTPRMTIAACGTGAGWRRAALTFSLDGGMRWAAIGSTALPALIGSVEAPAEFSEPAIEDLRHALVVVLANEAMQLGDADAAALDAGANLALVGEELLQFGNAEPLGGNRWRLTRLWRGRRGTEAAVGQAVPGDRFVLIEADMLRQIDLPIAGGGEVRVAAIGIGDGEGIEAKAARTGASIVPPSPIGARAAFHADHSVTLTWTRRSRLGWRWIDGGDAPVGEEAERYELRIVPASGAARFVSCDGPSCLLSPNERQGGAMTVEIRQAGDHGLSPPAVITIPAIEE